MDLVLVLVVLALIVLLVSAPLRRRGSAEGDEDAERAELEAAREAKYHEIRDAELDHRTGKLSDADWRVQDRALRAEAVDILRRLADPVRGRASRQEYRILRKSIFVAVPLAVLALAAPAAAHSSKHATTYKANVVAVQAQAAK